MTANGPTPPARRAKRAKGTVLGIVALSMAMLFTLLVPGETAEASAYSSPCPHYSIQDVFNDPNGNWDGDHVNNSDELYNGLNPCLVDTGTFCGTGGNPLCNYPTYRYIEYVQKDVVNNPCHRSTFLYPHDDYDRDGVTNQNEIWAGTDPCIYNAPPQVAPCPYYNAHQVTAWPNYDWDGDGVTNLVEWRQGTNPCVSNAVVVYQPVRPRVYRLPHVVNTYTPPPRRVVVQPVTVLPRVCPAGYPYFHPGNGQCYANPVKQLFS